MSKLKAKSIKLKVWIIIVLLLVPAGSLGFSTEDRNAVLNDAVFYDPNENNAVSGLGGCISPLLPSINDQDGFATAIDEYIRDKTPGSPLIGTGDEFVTAGIKYGLNPAWVVNIARKESTFGTRIPRDTFNSYGRTASANQPHTVQNGRLWYKYESFRASIDPQMEYLKRVYIDEGLTDFASITNKYAPPSENDTNGYVSQMEEWVGVVTALAGASLSCGGGESDEGGGGLTYPPNLGSPNSQGYYQLPEAASGEYVFYRNTCPKERFGKKELFGVFYTVAVKWKQANPSNVLMAGDLNANTDEHQTHKWGIGMDLYNQAGTATDVDSSNYSSAKAIELGKLLLDTKKIDDIWFHDQPVITALKAYAEAKSLPYKNMRIEFRDGSSAHRNHFHFNINAEKGPLAPAESQC